MRMQDFKSCKIWIIVGSTMLGWGYGLIAILSHDIAGATPGEMTVSTVCGAALFASAASALCRIYEVCQFIRETGNEPTDPTLCYRGVRAVPPFSSLTIDRKGQFSLIDDISCDPTGGECSSGSNLESEHESQDHPVNRELCFRGVHH